MTWTDVLVRTAWLNLVATLGLTAALAGCGDDTRSTAHDPSAPSSTAAATEPGSPSATTPSDADIGAPTGGGTSGTVAAPIYFVGDTPRGPRLYRELRRVEQDNPMSEALALLVAGDVLDHDYRTPLSGLVVDDVEHADGFITVTAGDDAVLDGLPRQQGRLAVQSLVYTLQGVERSHDPVRVVDGDGSPLTLFGVDTTDGVDRARQLKVLALVSVTTPQQGSVVHGDTLHASGLSSSFEATTAWRILDSDGDEVKRYSTTAEGWLGRLYPWSTDIDVSGLPDGDYTFVAETDDPTGGEGGGPDRDTKEFRIR